MTPDTVIEAILTPRVCQVIFCSIQKQCHFSNAMIYIENGSSTKESRLPFEIEEWVEMAIGMFVILLRLYARTRAVGFRKWQGDDYLSVVALVLWAVSIQFASEDEGVKVDIPCSRPRSSCSNSCVSSSLPKDSPPTDRFLLYSPLRRQCRTQRRAESIHGGVGDT